MDRKMLVGTSIATAMLGLGILAGSVIRSDVSAQTPGTDTETASPSTVQPNTQTPQTNQGDIEVSPFTERGPGTFKHGGPGMGDHGGFRHGGGHGYVTTADGAKSQIDRVTQQLTLAKSDLAYATGKMDTGDVERWLNSADSLLKSAQSSSDSTKYEQAGAYARAAGDLVMTAESRMGEKLGFDKLPSAGQRPQMPGKGDLATKPEATQAQASRMLAHTYENLVMQASVLKDGGDVATYITEAQNAYKAAYDAYNAANYSDAVAAGRLAERLMGVARQIHFALSATSSSDTPVTIPAPNF